MNFPEFLTDLNKKNIRVSFQEGKIKYSGPEQWIDDEFISNLKKFRGKLIQHFWPAQCSNLLALNPGEKKIPFFLVHGEKATYPLIGKLGNEYPLYGFLHYGSEGEKIAFSSIESLARDYINQMKSVLPNGPYLLGGFSFGGILAYEIAVQLKQEGNEVPLLVMVDCASPLAREPYRWHLNLPRHFYNLIFHPGRKEIIRRAKSFYCRCFLILRRSVPDKLRSFYIINTYSNLLKNYKPGKFKGRIMLLRATERKSAFTNLGWDTLVDEIELIYINGKHNTLYTNEELHRIVSSRIQEINNNRLSYNHL
jgi:thioesterase domain-containing protein